jgi:hypothetical protein
MSPLNGEPAPDQETGSDELCTKDCSMRGFLKLASMGKVRPAPREPETTWYR